MDAIMAKAQPNGTAKRLTAKPGTARPRLECSKFELSKPSQNLVVGVQTPVNFADKLECPRGTPGSPEQTKGPLRKRVRTINSVETDKHIFEDSHSKSHSEECATTSVSQDGPTERNDNKLSRKLTTLREKNLAFYKPATSDLNKSSSGETDRLHSKIRHLHDEVDQLSGKNGRLEEENIGLDDRNMELSGRVERLDHQITELNKKIGRLNGQLKAVYRKNMLDQNQYDLKIRKVTRLVGDSNQYMHDMPIIYSQRAHRAISDTSDCDHGVQCNHSELEAANTDLRCMYEKLENEAVESKKMCNVLENTAKEVLTFGNMMTNENFGDLGIALLKLRRLVHGEGG